jgi:hypothetical protein
MSQPLPDQNESFALIIDTSSSAARHLDDARRLAQLIYDLTGVVDEEQFKIFMIGSTTPISLAALRQTGPSVGGQQSQPCSLIAPIMETLVREERKRSVIIIGSGQIFDLDDWTDHPSFDGWLLVQIGAESLQGRDRRVSEIIAEQMGGDADTLLSYITRLPRHEMEYERYSSDGDAFEWQVDKTGYPLIFVEPLGAYVHLFPVTKPQFEKFISADPRREYGDKWYEEMIALNPRASYRSANVPAREQLFMTGLTPVESMAFGRWMGRTYSLLTRNQWSVCNRWFSEHTAPPMPPDLRDRLSRDALGIWEMVEAQCLEQNWPPNLQELSLMTQGILEWVVEQSGRYCGLGDPASSKSQRNAEHPVYPIGRGRHRNIGFRLCTR